MHLNLPDIDWSTYIWENLKQLTLNLHMYTMDLCGCCLLWLWLMSVCIHLHACVCRLRVRICTCLGAICTFSHYITFSSSSSGCGMWCY